MNALSREISLPLRDTILVNEAICPTIPHISISEPCQDLYFPLRVKQFVE